MDMGPLTPELVKRCDPGLGNFGSGTILALSGQCLRSAKLPSDCQICVESCPAGALHADDGQKPRVSTGCLHCAACVGICPTGAMAASTRTIQQVLRTLLQATLRVDDLTLTCQRSLALLRLQAESSRPEAALASLELARQAQSTESLLVLPCLAMLPRELWFTALNEIGVARIRRLLVWLPPGQCGQCPAGGGGPVEAAFSQAIDEAERWSGQTVGLVARAEELPQYRRADVRRYLKSDAGVDRRGAFTGLLAELRRTWDDGTRVGNRAADETLRNRQRKEAVNRTLLADDLKAPAVGRDHPVVSPFRQALVESLGRNPANAGRVRLVVSQTDADACDGCGRCVDACPVRARRLGGDAGGGAAWADPLYCLGCSACLQACPRSACSFQTISGAAYLR